MTGTSMGTRHPTKKKDLLISSTSVSQQKGGQPHFFYFFYFLLSWRCRVNEIMCRLIRLD
jgi:hypothetical protein